MKTASIALLVAAPLCLLLSLGGARSGSLDEADASSCDRMLQTARSPGDGDKVSAFELFNAYPPSRHAMDPEDAPVGFATGGSAHGSCLPPGLLDFLVFSGGELVPGDLRDASISSVWRISDEEFLVTFIHKDYEMEDGEGESVVLSGVITSPKGRPLALARHLSSWFQYEGSIRIRDLVHTRGEFVITEEVFDPVETDAAGHPLRYHSDGLRVIRQGRLQSSSFTAVF